MALEMMLMTQLELGGVCSPQGLTTMITVKDQLQQLTSEEASPVQLDISQA